jgi:thiamine kinase-like enzyme
MKFFSSKKIAILIFQKHSPTNSKVKKIKPIHTGYTNKNFKITTEDDKSYQVRYSSIKINELVDRKNEYKVLKLLNLPEYRYINENSGIVIKDWIEGENLYS